MAVSPHNVQILATWLLFSETEIYSYSEPEYMEIVRINPSVK